MVEHAARRVSSAAKRGVGGTAGGAVKRAGSAARGATGAVSAASGVDAVGSVGEHVQDAAAGVGGAVERAAGAGGERTVREELRDIVRQTALDVFVPIARTATTQAARYAITRGPQLARDTIAPKLAETLGAAIEEAGGPEAFARGWIAAVSEAPSGMLQNLLGGGESRPRPWRERRLPVEESIDVVVPLETAYDRFSEFEEYASVMSRGETVDERPHERITWARTDGVEAGAVITFHRLSDRLTRVMVTYDQDAQGLLEKTASVFRPRRRGLTTDLMRFKAFVEMSEEDAAPPGEDAEPKAAEPRAPKRIHARRDEHQHADGEESEGKLEADEKSRPAASRRRRAAARPRQPKARRG